MKYVLLTLLIITTACSYEHKPVFMRFGGDQLAANHDPDFKKGWEDG